MQIHRIASVAAVLAVSLPVSLAHGQCGTFADDVRYGAGDRPTSVAVGDVDGDLDLDLAVANWDGDNVSVLLTRISQMDLMCRYTDDSFGPAITGFS
jgi:hypothetical protein